MLLLLFGTAFLPFFWAGGRCEDGADDERREEWKPAAVAVTKAAGRRNDGAEYDCCGRPRFPMARRKTTAVVLVLLGWA